MTVFIDTYEWQKLNPNNTPELRGFFLSDDIQDVSIPEIFGERVKMTELKQGLSIETTSFVGRVKLGQLHLTIRPKKQMNSLLNLVRYAYGLRDLTLTNTSPQSLEENTFQDLLILQFLAEVRELWLRGLRKEYQERLEPLSTLRGRVNIQQIVRQGGVRDATIPNIYHPRNNDTLLNQVILAGLYFVAHITNDLELRSEARRQAMLFEDNVTRKPLTSDLLKAAYLQINRLSESYRSLLDVLNFLLQGQGVSITEQLQTSLSGFLFDMNSFWEVLMSRFLKSNLGDLQVIDQYRAPMMQYRKEYNPQKRRNPLPRPDFVVMSENNIVAILDAKYINIWNRTPDSKILYQLGIYALGHEDISKSTILYPTVEKNAEIEKLDIQDAVNHGTKATITLFPVDMYHLESLILNNTSAGHRVRRLYAHSLLGI